MNSRPLTCREAQDLITSEIDHRLSENDCLALQLHLSLCQECEKEYHTEKEVKDLLARHCKSVHIPEKLNNKISALLSDPEKMASLSADLKENSPVLLHGQFLLEKKRYLFAVIITSALVFIASVYFLVIL